MESKRDFFVENIKRHFRQGDVVIKLILVLLGVYLVQLTIQIIEFVLRLDAHPLSTILEQLFFLSKFNLATVYKFYTLLSYQFFHDGFLHLFVNLVLLYFFGKLVLAQLGLKKFIPLYFLGGIFSGIVYLLVGESSKFEFGAAAGASASIMALIGTATILKPNLNIKLFFVLDVHLKWLVIGLAALNFFYLLSPETTGSGLLHLSGLAFGVLFILLDQRGISLSKPFNQIINRLLVFFNYKQVANFLKKPTEKQSKKEASKQQDQLDAILSKIASNGYESLSKAEKEFLFKSNNN